MKKPAKILAIGVPLLGVAALAAHLLRLAGVFGNFQPGFAGTCATIPLGGGAADIRVDRERGLAYLSMLDHAAAERGDGVTGTVTLLDLNLAAPAPRAAMSFDPPGFMPGGLALFKATAAPARLFVLSHHVDGTTSVEIAEQDADGAFVPRESVTDAAFARATAISAVGPRQFYLAIDHSPAGTLSRWWAALIGRQDSSLLFFDGKRPRVVVTDLTAPSSLALSADGSQLYLSDALRKRLLVFRRDPNTGELQAGDAVSLDSAPLGLDVDAAGVVWIAAAPQPFALGDPATSSATQLLRYDPRKRQVSQVYGNDGAQLSAAHAVSGWRGEFLAGSPFDHKVLICKPNP